MFAKGASITIRVMWVGPAEESDEHLLVNEWDHVVSVCVCECFTTLCGEREQWSKRYQALSAAFLLQAGREMDANGRLRSIGASTWTHTHTSHDAKCVDAAV